MTAGLIKSVKYNYRLYIQKMLNRSSVSTKSKFIVCRNQLNILIKKCKIYYYTDKFNDAKNNVKKTWSIIKTILNKNASWVTLIYKIGDHCELVNYRPISVFSVFSKLNKFNILFNGQYGFRSYHSTDMALIDMVNKIIKGFENNYIVV